MSELLHHPEMAGGPPPAISILAEAPSAAPMPAGLVARTILVSLPPGSPGAPPHRHPGPLYAYVLKGAVVFELEGEPERVIRAGEAFFEPGGDVIHYRGGNALEDEESALVVTMICAPRGAGAHRGRARRTGSAQTPARVTERRGVRSQLT